LPATSCDLPGLLMRKHLPLKAARSPYLVLLPAGFALPLALPQARCALTAPFHPYPSCAGRYNFCGTFPEVTFGGGYPPPFSVEPGLSSRYCYPAITRPSGGRESSASQAAPQARLPRLHPTLLQYRRGGNGAGKPPPPCAWPRRTRRHAPRHSRIRLSPTAF